MYDRIVVVGLAGCGKTTLAHQLAQRFALAHIELDALFWDAGWQQAPDTVFHARVAEALKAPRWVADGNYRRVRDLVWARADTIIWLDYTRLRLYRQLIPRTIRRIVTQNELWNGNRESWAEQLGRDSLLWYVWNKYRQSRRDYAALFAGTEYAHCERVRLSSPQATQRWLERLIASHPPRA